MMQPKDYYKILGVSETATADEIKKAYRKIARSSHPDRNPGNPAAEERFKEASEAYEILSDAEKRHKFDAFRRYGGFAPGGGEAQGFPGGFESMPGGFRVHQNQGEMGDLNFSDLFGEDPRFASIFEQIFAQMGPAGASPGGGRSRRGAFGARRPRRSPRNDGAESVAGDRFFERDGLDVHCTIWLKLEQLERGAKVKVRTPSGKKALVRIPAGFQIGAVLRLPGFGLHEDGRQGDQYVHVEAVA
jgi:DnaJ-class molecular chaperone